MTDEITDNMDPETWRDLHEDEDAREREVPAIHDWPTNGHLIADVARLGYLDGTVLDCTFGRGTFWRRWRPTKLVATDLRQDCAPDGAYDFRRLPFVDSAFDVVVFDPPYKLNGQPDEEVDERYGVHEPTPWRERMDLIRDGFIECLRVADQRVLVKCMDQVCSGKMRWQTSMVIAAANERGWRLRDRFDMVGSTRTQPAGRRQLHARGRGSTLLVFEHEPEEYGWVSSQWLHQILDGIRRGTP